eukprot:1160610-Pelagomonas_calceolata.AAC.3
MGIKAWDKAALLSFVEEEHMTLVHPPQSLREQLNPKKFDIKELCSFWRCFSVWPVRCIFQPSSQQVVLREWRHESRSARQKQISHTSHHGPDQSIAAHTLYLSNMFRNTCAWFAVHVLFLFAVRQARLHKALQVAHGEKNKCTANLP